VQATRQIRFTNVREIVEMESVFNALTPGRQRAYLLYFSAPKQTKTRVSRVEKCMQKILNGKGLNDQYTDISKDDRFDEARDCF
jgi:uncharacterized protein YdeI (YjbR/CyaY-like superfamily)